ncbi:MAG: hypothetical protein ACLUEQ_10720 [Cloacibacillus evryensis]
MTRSALPAVRKYDDVTVSMYEYPAPPTRTVYPSSAASPLGHPEDHKVTRALEEAYKNLTAPRAGGGDSP